MIDDDLMTQFVLSAWYKTDLALKSAPANMSEDFKRKMAFSHGAAAMLGGLQGAISQGIDPEEWIEAAIRSMDRLGKRKAS